MQCNECNKELGNYINNEHLYACCGLTLQEYALRHHVPLDLLLNADQINQSDDVANYLKPENLSNNSSSQQVQDMLAGLYMADAIQQDGEFSLITLGIRRLEQLLWYQNALQMIGFKFKQEYFYENDGHRVIAKNSLKIPTTFLPARISDTPSTKASATIANSSDASLLQQISVLIAHVGELHAGYLFIDFPNLADAQRIESELAKKHQIRLKPLDVTEHENGQLMRCETLEDTTRLISLLSEYLQEIPNACERFFEQHEEATVVKELVFDSAHFITDHPDKCVNLHGGRYAMNVKVKDHIDPLTGFVLDYGYLKRIAKEKIVDKLDHHTLNYVSAELSWRSSTELLNIFIWEKLIEYLPGLTELQIYETSQSHCCFVGPSLDELQKKGGSALLKHFSSEALGKSQLRNILDQSAQRRLKVIG